MYVKATERFRQTFGSFLRNPELYKTFWTHCLLICRKLWNNLTIMYLLSFVHSKMRLQTRFLCVSTNIAQDTPVNLFFTNKFSISPLSCFMYDWSGWPCSFGIVLSCRKWHNLAVAMCVLDFLFPGTLGQGLRHHNRVWGSKKGGLWTLIYGWHFGPS